MSGSENEDDLRAGEYVLGLLDSDERRLLLSEAELRPELAAAITRWEGRLAPLLAQVPPVDPPAALWTRVEASAFGSPANPAELLVRGFWNDVRLWRAATVAFAVAAGIAGVALLQQPAVAPVPVAALLPTHNRGPAIIASAWPDGRLALQPIERLSVPGGHDLELWSLPAGATRPVSLGVMPSSGIVLKASRAPHEDGRILISLEPLGGSPTSLPTGPVLWSGILKRQSS